MIKLGPLKMALAVFLLCVTTSSPAQSFNSLSFNGSDGYDPELFSPVQGRDGNLYGTTFYGGVNGEGTVFRTTTRGALTVLYSFCSQPNCADGVIPTGLVLASDGSLYGTTSADGTGYDGTVYRITSGGILTTLHRFNGADGNNPYGALVQGTDGSFYGTTSSGGASAYGTVFKMTPGGTLTTLHSFNNSDGAGPLAGLVQASDGNFYGTTSSGGNLACDAPYGCGTVFKITSRGALTTLHSFDGADGADVVGGLIQAGDGNLYGTTARGGSGDGTAFMLGPDGTLTTLYNFPTGSEVYAGLVQATDGNFYGTTSQADQNNPYGTIFEITSSGALTTLHNFDSTAGAYPYGGLVQHTNGAFYGTTALGGSGNNCGVDGCGTIFSLDTRLGPFVSFVRATGKVGQTGGILGQGFTGTTSVSLNGIPASFTVASDTFIRATVPPGATTGYVTVVTPSGTLTSNVPFHVLQ